MKLNNLYNMAEKEKIIIFDWYIEDSEGILINIDKINAIALNYSNLETSIDEKCVLAEELGHYYMDATYPLLTNNKLLIDKQEYRAKKWSYYALIPYENLKSAILKRN